MSQVASQKAVIRLLLEKGIFSEEEFVEMDERDLEEQAWRGVAEAIGNHTIAIDVSLASDFNPDWGTGTLLKIRNGFFITTCKHVVKPKYKNEDLRFFFKGETGFKWVNKEVITKSSLHKLARMTEHNYSRKVTIIDRIYSGDDLDDLVLLKVDPIQSEINNHKFYEIKSFDIKTPTSSTNVYYVGFSRELKRVITPKGDIAVFPFCGASQIIEKDIFSDQYDPEKHFLIDFNSNVVQESIDPSGLSGCGIWSRFLSGKDKLWTPNIYLIGVQHGYFRKSEVLTATRIERIIRLIK